MDETRCFIGGSEKFSEAIDAYQTQRISEKEYLNTVTQVMESVVSRTGDKLPEILRDRDVAKAFYGVVAEVFDRLNPNGTASSEVAANVAVKIDVY